ncbi:MAG: helix-turn-helix transcriptional regulator [Thermodesulfobacteriota bacterium]
MDTQTAAQGMIDADKKLLTTVEAAEFLRIKPNTVEVWRTQGRGPRFVKLGGAVRYRTADLEAFIAASLRGPDPLRQAG